MYRLRRHLSVTARSVVHDEGLVGPDLSRGLILFAYRWCRREVVEMESQPKDLCPARPSLPRRSEAALEPSHRPTISLQQCIRDHPIEDRTTKGKICRPEAGVPALMYVFQVRLYMPLACDFTAAFHLAVGATRPGIWSQLHRKTSRSWTAEKGIYETR